MQQNTEKPAALGLVVLGALARLIPHPPNMVPVGGLSLFSGARLRGWRAYLVPLLLMAISDPLVGGYSFATPFVYASFLINVWIGTRLRGAQGPVKIGGAATAGAVQFFLVTNFGTWLGSTHVYPHTLAGLMACYTAAIPFFWRTLAGDLFYTAALFGLYALATRRMAHREGHPAAA
jgi:hypothetical protein